MAQVFVEDPAGPELGDEDAHHLGRVLRLRPGEEVVVSDGRGHWARTAWRGDGRGAALRARGGPGGDGSVQVEAALEPALTVVFAPTKGERPEWVVQKLTELGIDRIVPLRSERSVVRWTGQRGQATVERLRRVAREAAAQCRRVWLPEVAETIAFKDLGALGAPGEVALAQLSGDRPDGGRAGDRRRPRGRVEQRRAGVGPAHGGFRAERAAGRDRRRDGGGAHGLPADGYRGPSGRSVAVTRGPGRRT